MTSLLGKTILVLEHNVEVSTTIKLMLESLGHTVVVVSLPGDALAVLSKQQIDVVLTNHVGRTFEIGEYFPSFVRTVQPQCAVLLTARQRESGRGPLPRCSVLLKPFSVSELDASIASLCAS